MKIQGAFDFLPSFGLKEPIRTLVHLAIFLVGLYAITPFLHFLTHSSVGWISSPPYQI